VNPSPIVASLSIAISDASLVSSIVPGVEGGFNYILSGIDKIRCWKLAESLGYPTEIAVSV
jgi:hypothetical protein